VVDNPLRSVLDEPRPSCPPVRVWRDWALLAVVVASGLLEAAARDDLPLPWLSVLVTVGLAPTLLWRRTHPFAMVAIAFGVSAVVDLALLFADAPALDSYVVVYFLLLPYSLFRWGSGRESVAGLAVVLVAAAIGLYATWPGPADAIGGMAVLLSTVALGLSVRAQHGAGERRLEQVKSEERVQLARELHDTVAHHVSAIAIQAQAGRALARTSPASSLAALEVIEAEASRTLAEMRAMVRVLRNQKPADFAPQPGVADLDSLLGPPQAVPGVEVKLSGELDGLPTTVDAAIFRIAQEAVTNARSHARNATRIEVCVAGERSCVRLHVEDDGEAHPAGPSPGSGFGLVGMGERAHLLGGTCVAGPRAERGWAVDVMLPLEVTA